MTTIHHPLSAEDCETMAKVRATALAGKGVLERGAFDALLESTPPAPGVIYEAAKVGGVAGFWCRPTGAMEKSAILYLHGGAYIVGSARAYRHFVGQIAARARCVAFVADYALAPEHPFPAALNDARAAYRGLVGLGYAHIALAGDSCGGGLALVLLALSVEEARDGIAGTPTGAAVLSPWTDLALTGATLESRADADPFLTRAALATAASLYLGQTSPRDALASPLYGKPQHLPPVCLHVGEDEILLEDSLRFAERFDGPAANMTLNVWEGMPHVFLSMVGTLGAASIALDEVGAFLKALAHPGSITASALREPTVGGHPPHPEVQK
jgi:epsilon-lactone hydrolase